MHRDIIREAARVARDDEYLSSSVSASAIAETRASISMAVWSNDLRLITLLRARSSVACRRLAVEHGRVLLVDASEFQQIYSRAKPAAAEESIAAIERDTPAAASANSKSQQQKGVRRLNGRRELDSLPSLLVAPGHLCGDIVASLL